MGFLNRQEAAERLASVLAPYRGTNPLVLGIPRGSVPMAKYLADSLQGDLDVVLVHKIGAPNHPEFAIGSVSESGDLYRSESLSEMLLPRDYIEKQAQEEVTRLRARRTIYSPIRPPLSPKDRTVIIVDDGIATGCTILAAIRSLRGQNPKKLIVATPVASPRVLDRLKAEVDELVVLKTPLEFLSVGQFYDEFPQVSDEEVLQALTQTQTPPAQTQAAAS